MKAGKKVQKKTTQTRLSYNRNKINIYIVFLKFIDINGHKKTTWTCRKCPNTVANMYTTFNAIGGSREIQNANVNLLGQIIGTWVIKLGSKMLIKIYAKLCKFYIKRQQIKYRTDKMFFLLNRKLFLKRRIHNLFYTR